MLDAVLIKGYINITKELKFTKTVTGAVVIASRVTGRTRTVTV
jgi:hypothetical protein